jgi:hypothetical protein
MTEDVPNTNPLYQQPTRLGSLMYVVRTLLDYGRHLADTVVQRAKQPSFASIAVGFGTADLPLIMARLQRGILRTIALARMLDDRLATGRDIHPNTPVGYRAKPAPEPGPEPKAAPTPRSRTTPRITSAQWDDLYSSFTLEQTEAHVRRRPIGRTIIDICLDFAVLPIQCNDEFWEHLFAAMYWHRGNFGRWGREERRRYKTFDHERNHKPNNGWWEWWDATKERILQSLGFRIGDPPMLPAPP